MAHEFESGFFGGNKPAWHGLGTVIPDDVVAAGEAIKLAGLDWGVELVPLYAHAPSGSAEMVRVESRYGVQRQTDGRVLGVVSDRYAPVQNREAFDFLDTLTGTGEAKYHTAGALKGGRVVWLLARIPHDVVVGGMDSEKVETFLLLSNSFDATRSLGVCVTPVRVVCANTLQAALGGTARAWYLRHTGDMAGRIEQAKKTLGLTRRYVAEFAETANRLLAQKLTPADFTNFVVKLLPYKDSDIQPGDRAARSIDEARETIIEIYKHADNLANVRGTAWAAWNAAAEFSDHRRKFRKPENRLARIMSDFDLKDRALSLLLV